MKSTLVVVLASASAVAGFGAEVVSAPPAQSAAQQQSVDLTPTMIFAGQVAEIASSTTLSHAEKEQRIGNALQFAIDAATVDQKDPSQILKTVLDLATAAVKVAPEFAGIVTKTVLALPMVAALEGAAAQVVTTIQAAVKEATAVEVATASPTAQHGTSTPEFGGSTADTVVSHYR